MDSSLKLLTLTFLSSISLSSLAADATLTTHSGPIAIDWISDRYAGYDRVGDPLNVTNINSELPTTFLTDIYSRIPDGRRVNPDYIDGTSRSNLVIDDDFSGQVTVSATFLNEGAFFRNTFGYFLYDPDSPPQTFMDIAEHKIIFPNASKPPAGGLVQGDSVPLDVELVAGQAMGFFVIPNGWGFSSSYAELESSGYWNQPFYSLPHLNPEPEGEKQHNVVFYDTQSELLVIGFEDVHRRQGDNDFNDLIFSLTVTPIYALEGIDAGGSVEGEGYNLLNDTPEPAGSTSYYPSRTGYGTLMYEDMWPIMGDYDFNDLVVKYRYTIDKNYLGAVESLEMTYQIQAIGADYHNGFALHLPNVLKSNIQSASITYGQESVTLTPEADAGEVVFILSADVWADISSQCGMFRTVKDCNETMGQEYVFAVEFTEAVSESSLGLPPYDPFIFATVGKYHGNFSGRQWEVHLKEFSGTSLFNVGWMGLHDDNSNAINSFVNDNNMPWAMNLADGFAHPVERVDIQQAYPDFRTWVLSSGGEKTDWYERRKAVLEKIFD
ncbi:LruC domain-containing protein [Shewanella corallii]|uniref:LruC domain-containing protein n=1 Tax=Shewanella corallii TaxID=560080 RepID=A0ABT0NAZ8_9GAMM|nr:LruC domain-containing protein [Shewanella corallii]MCL2915540.1 LruC domain-containing protein [Shewanella corallii]